MERSEFPRTKVCGEYLGQSARAELEDLGIAGSVQNEASDLRQIRLHVKGQTVDLPFAGGAWSLARARLDSLLCSHAQAAGALLVTARAESFKRTGSGFTIGFRTASGSEDTLSAQTIVGADGMGSIVARAFGLTKKPRGPARFALGGHYRGFGHLDHNIEMYVRGKSYFAINPLGGELANVMVIVDQSTLAHWRGAIDERLQETARELAGGRREIDAVGLVGKRVAIGPLQHCTHAPARVGVYLIGDAAGFLDPFTGQGVSLALRSAALAAESIASGEDDAHLRYERKQRKLFAGRARVAGLTSALLATPWLTEVAARTLQQSPSLRTRLMHLVTAAR
jgi:flavin-dependent dehydrogenase